MSCYVCLSDVVRAVNCAGSCDESICRECFRQYIEFSNKTSSLPYCPCGSTFRRTTVARCACPEEVKKYDEIVYKEAKLSVDNFDRHLIARDSILANFRAEKAKFMETIPKGFAFVLNTCMKDKVKKIEQRMLKKTGIAFAKNTPCKKLMCPGTLDTEGRCGICSTIFCVECEIEKNGKEHKCDQADLDTVKLVKQMVECPNCKVKITKSYGCNSITCSICKTNFNFVTGERSLMGSDDPQHLEIRSRQLVDIIPVLEFRDLLAALAKQEPKQFKLRRSDLGKDPSVLGRLIVKQNENIKDTKAYFALLRKVEKEYAAGTLTKAMLRSIVVGE